MPKSLGEMLDRVLQNVKTQSVMDAAEPFDPRPFQSAFLTLLKELMEQNIEVSCRLLHNHYNRLQSDSSHLNVKYNNLGVFMENN